MSIFDLFDLLLENNIDLNLIGEIEIEDESIKWSYDGLGNVMSEMREHLEETFDSDKEVINDFLRDKNIQENFYFALPDFDETFITAILYEK